MKAQNFGKILITELIKEPVVSITNGIIGIKNLTSL
jgi:hypothetical protein